MSNQFPQLSKLVFYYFLGQLFWCMHVINCESHVTSDFLYEFMLISGFDDVP